jgi:hypothetical protein
VPLAENIQPDGRSLNLFIGRSGSGKSAAAYSYPKPLHVLDLDGRIRGGLVPWIDRKGISYDYFPPKPPKGTVFDALNQYFDTLSILFKNRQSDLATLVLDSATWQANDLLLDAIPLTHAGGPGESKGKSIGTMQIGGPSDYMFQSTGMIQTIAYLKSLPIPNIIVTAHVVNRWGKRKDESGKILDPFGPSEVIGEQLSLTDKLAETLPSSFDNIFRFEKVDNGYSLKFYFEGEGELARNTFNLGYPRIEITKTDFYQSLMKRIKPATADATVSPTTVTLTK